MKKILLISFLSWSFIAFGCNLHLEENSNSGRLPKVNQNKLCDLVTKVRTIPAEKGRRGGDEFYTEIIRNPETYKNCLIDFLDDGTVVPSTNALDRPQNKVTTRALVAYWLLSDSEALEFGTCIPDDVMKRVDFIGADAYIDWINNSDNRPALKSCVENFFVQN